MNGHRELRLDAPSATRWAVLSASGRSEALSLRVGGWFG
jgi:hypothetical protein